MRNSRLCFQTLGIFLLMAVISSGCNIELVDLPATQAAMAATQTVMAVTQTALASTAMQTEPAGSPSPTSHTMTPTPTTTPAAGTTATATPTTRSHTPTAEPSATEIPLTRGELLFEDDFDDNRNSWILLDHEQFWISDGFYHASLSKGESWNVFSDGYFEELRNFVYEAAFQEVEGNGGYGLLFRVHHPGWHWYERAYGFEVIPAQQIFNLERVDFTKGDTGSDWPTPLAVRRYVPSLNWEAATHTLTVMAQENRFSLYIDGQFIDTLEDKDDLYQKGTIGFGFSNAHIAVDYVRVWALPSDATTASPTATTPPEPTRTPSTTPTPLARGELLFEDNFDDNRNGWYSELDVAWIEDGYYHLSVDKGTSRYAFPSHHLELHDFIYEVEISEMEFSNERGYALLFRVSQPQPENSTRRFYSFGVLSGQQVHNLERVDWTVDGTREGWPSALRWNGFSPLIDWQAKNHNLTVVAHENQFDLYIDGYLVDSLVDEENLFEVGSIGFEVEATHIKMDHVRVWALP